MSSFRRPHALALGGGGILGEAWMIAVLAGLEETTGFDATDCESYVGTSAGSIVAAHLVAGASPSERLEHPPEQLPVAETDATGARLLVGQAARLAGAAAGAAAAPLAATALRLTASGGALVRRVALGQLAHGRRSLGELRRSIERVGVHFDGRLLVSAVDLASGRRVVFGGAGAPRASVAQAVEASCAIPGFFRPVRIAGRSYVDGGAWSPTNLDALSARRGMRVLCLNPTGALGRQRRSPAAALGFASSSIATLESLALERAGARVFRVSPDERSSAAMGPNLMDARPRAEVIAAGFAQGRALGGRLR